MILSKAGIHSITFLALYLYLYDFLSSTTVKLKLILSFINFCRACLSGRNIVPSRAKSGT